VSEDLRERIVDAALHLLESEGPKGFGQVRVAREAGVAQGHLTYYFPRKSDLAAAVLERLTRDARREMAPLLLHAHTLSDDERHALFFAHVHTMLHNDQRTRVLLGLFTAALDDTSLAAALAGMLDVQRAAMALLLGREADDVTVHMALATLRGLGIENLVRRADAEQTREMLARFRQWLGRIT
jgi:AcrR family transcriptional regulator